MGGRPRLAARRGQSPANGDAEPQFPDDDIGSAGELEFELTHLREDAARSLEENLAYDGRANRAELTVEEAEARLILEFLKSLGHRRLRCAESARGFCEALPLADREESAKPNEVDLDHTYLPLGHHRSRPGHQSNLIPCRKAKHILPSSQEHVRNDGAQKNGTASAAGERVHRGGRRLATPGKLRKAGRRKPHRLRLQVVELVFGQVEQARGCRRVLLRGVDKVRSEWARLCNAHNLQKLANAAA